jgi:hypothetical protein
MRIAFVERLMLRQGAAGTIPVVAPMLGHSAAGWKRLR